VEQLQQQATAAHAQHAAEVQALRETSTAAFVALQVRAGQKYCVHAMECLQSSQPMQQGKSEQASVINIPKQLHMGAAVHCPFVGALECVGGASAAAAAGSGGAAATAA
jgi:hypothetical protein